MASRRKAKGDKYLCIIIYNHHINELRVKLDSFILTVTGSGAVPDCFCWLFFPSRDMFTCLADHRKSPQKVRWSRLKWFLMVNMIQSVLITLSGFGYVYSEDALCL